MVNGLFPKLCVWLSGCVCGRWVVVSCVWRVGGRCVWWVGVSACVRAWWVDGWVGVWRVCKWADVYVGWLCWFVVCVVG